MRIKKDKLEVTEEYLQYSGPHVWPEISAQMVVDRFLHRRIELAYLSALDKLGTNKYSDEAAGHMKIRVTRLRRDRTASQSRSKTLFTFEHGVNPNRLEDVRSMLSELRSVLARRMPDTPLLSTVIVVAFLTDNPSGRPQPHVLGRVMEPWL